MTFLITNTYLLTYLLSYFLTFLLAYSLTYTLAYSLTYTLTYSLTCLRCSCSMVCVNGEIVAQGSQVCIQTKFHPPLHLYNLPCPQGSQAFIQTKFPRILRSVLYKLSCPQGPQACIQTKSHLPLHPNFHLHGQPNRPLTSKTHVPRRNLNLKTAGLPFYVTPSPVFLQLPQC